MTKRIVKLIIIMVLTVVSQPLCFCETYAVSTLDEVIKGADQFMQEGASTALNSAGNTLQSQQQGAGTALDEAKLKETSDILFNVLLGIAFVATVVIGLIIGIQFMVASVGDRAKLKESLVPYTIGCIVVFGAFGIWKLAVTILSRW